MDIFSLTLLAKEAAKEAISGASSLNTSISKLAREKALTQTQIENVAALANQETNTYFRENSKVGTYTFDLADAKQIIESLRANPILNKVASDNSNKLATLLAKHSKSVEVRKSSIDSAFEKIAAEERFEQAVSLATKIAKILPAIVTEVDLEKQAALSRLQEVINKTAQSVQDGLLLETVSWDELSKFAAATQLENADILLKAVATTLSEKGDRRLTKIANAFLENPPQDSASQYGVKVNTEHELYSFFDRATKDISNVSRLNVIRYNLDDLMEHLPERREEYIGENAVSAKVVADLAELYGKTNALRSGPSTLLEKEAFVATALKTVGGWLGKKLITPVVKAVKDTATGASRWNATRKASGIGAATRGTARRLLANKALKVGKNVAIGTAATKVLGGVKNKLQEVDHVQPYSDRVDSAGGY